MTGYKWGAYAGAELWAVAHSPRTLRQWRRWGYQIRVIPRTDHAKCWADLGVFCLRPGQPVPYEALGFHIETNVGPYRISTAGNLRSPMLQMRIPFGFAFTETGLIDMFFETAVFGPDGVDILRRYLTAADAREGHAKIVAAYIDQRKQTP